MFLKQLPGERELEAGGGPQQQIFRRLKPADQAIDVGFREGDEREHGRVRIVLLWPAGAGSGRCRSGCRRSPVTFRRGGRNACMTADPLGSSPDIAPPPREPHSSRRDSWEI